MPKRYVSIWFRYLLTDRSAQHTPQLNKLPFVLVAPERGRMMIVAANALAQKESIDPGMVLADAKAVFPSLQYKDAKPGLELVLLNNLAEWCIRYGPVVAIDLPDGLILDATGCAHLWGGENAYLKDISNRFRCMGYYVHAAIADTIGKAWAFARFVSSNNVIEDETTTLLALPPASLRIEHSTIERLNKLGIRQIRELVNIPRPALRRRFGHLLLQRLDQALGQEQEFIQPVQPVEVFEEHLPCLEPISTARGIEIALTRLLDTLCERLYKQQKGVRTAVFKCYRIDGKMEQIEIGTSRASHNAVHLFKLFELKIDTIEPALGIELFILQAPKVDDVIVPQEKLWNGTSGLLDPGIAELIDRIEGKIGGGHIHRYLPAEHHWPERSIKPAISLDETPSIPWRTDKPRPIQLLPVPEKIAVTAPIPDYPPMQFNYKGKLHKVAKADGPERIEREWWIDKGLHRDYYAVENELGQRYWLFRLGHYDDDEVPEWYVHGFFA
jgi:protein ImuB